MNHSWFILSLLLYVGVFPYGFSKNVSRPATVRIGAIFTFNSTIGRVAKIAMEQAVKDVNSNSSILPGTKLDLTMQDSNCSGFFGMVEGTLFFLNLVSSFSLDLLIFIIRQEFCSKKNLIAPITCTDYGVELQLWNLWRLIQLLS